MLRFGVTPIPHTIGLPTRNLHLRSKKPKVQLSYIFPPTLTMARGTQRTYANIPSLE